MHTSEQYFAELAACLSWLPRRAIPAVCPAILRRMPEYCISVETAAA